MSDLLSGSFSRFRDSGDSHAIEVSSYAGGGGAGVNLDKFSEDAESIKDELKEMESLHQRLQSCHEHIQTLHNARAVKDLRAWMEWDVGEALKKAKAVKVRLEALERANAANQNLAGCGPGSSSDRTRTSVVDGLGKKLKDNMEGFNKLREKLSSEYKETAKRRYFAVTGQKPAKRTVDLLISTGESETFLRKEIQEQGRGGFLDTIQEIQESDDPEKDMERNLKKSRRLLFLIFIVMVLMALLIGLSAAI
ncbi:syntaxin-121-like [Syzygium oleosum]|uniref:syntaxin-121-like n=1 Tax=Syzygium oleosum TaxID=219896 RepID=UPI0011D258C1|nr:syntaxin-121-like [Syzygium oleosum]